MVYIPIYWVNNAFLASAGLPLFGLLPMSNDLASLGNETNLSIAAKGKQWIQTLFFITIR